MGAQRRNLEKLLRSAYDLQRRQQTIVIARSFTSMEVNNTSQDKTVWQKLLDFFEHAWVLTSLATIGTLVGFFYTPVLVACGSAILLAFHRVGVVRRQKIAVQIAAYLILFLVTTFGLYGADQAVKKNWPHIPSVPEIVDGVRKLMASTPAPTPTPVIVQPPTPSFADITVQFLDPKDVVYEMLNVSDQVASDPKYWFGLFDLDFPEERKTQALPIPARTMTGDYLRPHDKYLPTDVLSYHPEVRAMVKKGDRVFGWMGVTCRNCIRTRAYWLYFVDGQGGWYSEMPAKLVKGEAFPIDIDKLRHDTEAGLNEYASPKKRIKIPPYH
ncbi:MAG TPA: hypothetical protein VOA64_08100 [Candidatus Dormibacteraeota bacterium]|nr:hypothetical protein [Candidatus Dormibacteraeota bacterium]